MASGTQQGTEYAQSQLAHLQSFSSAMEQLRSQAITASEQGQAIASQVAAGVAEIEQNLALKPPESLVEARQYGFGLADFESLGRFHIQQRNHAIVYHHGIALRA